MPHYIYACDDCCKAYQDRLVPEQEENTEDFESSVLFETSHRMNPTQEELNKALICPRCKSTNATKTMYGMNFTSYVRGYGWLDKAGVARDRHTHKLLNDDPYAQYRQDGEVQQIKENLQKKGKVQTKPLHFTSKVTSDDVTKAVYKQNTD